MTIDAERVETEIYNHMDLLYLHLRKLEAIRTKVPHDEQMRLSRTANILAGRAVGLANEARRVNLLYPRMT